MTLPVCYPVRPRFGTNAVLASPLFIAAAVGLALALSAAPAAAQGNEGMLVTVPNPIDSDAYKRIKAQINSRLDEKNPRPRPQTIIFDFNPDGKPASTANFGACLDLEDYIQKVVNLNTNTVAFVRANVTGHTVLPVLACREMVMSKNASIGQIAGAGVDPVDGNKAVFYESVLKPRNKEHLVAVVRKMYDPAVQLRSGIGKAAPFAGKKIYIDLRTERDKVAGPTPVPNVPDGQIGLYSAETARSLELGNGIAETRAEVAEIYGLPPSVLRDDPLQGRTPDVYQWELTGEIDGATKESVARVIRDLRAKGGNVLILTINAGGHDLDAARGLADELRAAQTGENPIKVIAFVPDSARAAGTVAALGASEIVMVKTKPDANGEVKESEIGDFSGYVDPKTTKPADVEANRKSIRDLAQAQGYPAVLIDGMFLKDMEIVRVTKKAQQNQRRFMTDTEFNNNKNEWDLDKTVKPKGQLLKLNATLAVEYGIARTAVERPDVKAVTAAFGWPEAKDSDPGWLTRFSDFLKQPVVTVLLVVIGFTGLILELKVPGLTVPGIIAALCFILVFWAHSKFSGQTFVLALLLFLLGLVLVGIELFVLPGFGAAGISGILCMLGGLALVTLDKIPQTGSEWGDLGVRISQYMFAMMGALVLAFFIARFLPKLPGANRLVLNAPAESPASESLPGGIEAAELLGAIGTSSTALRPAGVVKFGDKFVDVVSDGAFVPAGTRVQVIQVEGTRIVVKEV